MENHAQNVVEKLFPDPFLKNQMPSWELSKFIKLSCRPIAFTSCKTYLKKRGLELVFLSHFLYNYWRKIFRLLYFINCPNFIFCFSLFREILGNMCIVIVCFPGSDVINFEVNLIILIMPFFLHDQNVKTKI